MTERDWIRVRGLTKCYGTQCVFDRADLAFERGKVTCIMGASGSGKTTLLNVLAGLTDYEGTVEPRLADGGVGYVFQSPRLVPHLTVLQNLTYVGIGQARAMELLAETEMAEHADKLPRELSGGMAQRVGMSRAFGTESELLLMDEPYRNLDLALRARLVRLLGQSLSRHPRTVVYVTHDVDEAVAVSDRTIVLTQAGTVVVESDQAPGFDLAHTEGDFRSRLMQVVMAL